MTNYFIVLICFWFGAELFYTWRLRDKQQRRSDQKSLPLLWLSVLAGVSAGVWLTLKTVGIFHVGTTLQFLGMLLMLIGILGRAHVVYQLGKFFTVNVRIHDQHELKTDGYFRLVRHPSYAFLLLTFVGFCLVLQYWLAALAILCPILLAFSYRIKLEENLLAAHFGAAYQAYQQQSKRLIPFVW